MHLAQQPMCSRSAWGLSPNLHAVRCCDMKLLWGCNKPWGHVYAERLTGLLLRRSPRGGSCRRAWLLLCWGGSRQGCLHDMSIQINSARAQHPAPVVHSKAFYSMAKGQLSTPGVSCSRL